MRRASSGGPHCSLRRTIQEREQLAVRQCLPAVRDRREPSPLLPALERQPAPAILRLDDDARLTLLAAVADGSPPQTPIAAGTPIDDGRMCVPYIPPSPIVVLQPSMRHRPSSSARWFGARLSKPPQPAGRFGPRRFEPVRSSSIRSAPVIFRTSAA